MSFLTRSVWSLFYLGVLISLFKFIHLKPLRKSKSNLNLEEVNANILGGSIMLIGFLMGFDSAKPVFNSYRRLSEFPFASFGADLIYLSFVNKKEIREMMQKRYGIPSAFFKPEYMKIMESYLCSIQMKFHRSILVKVDQPDLKKDLTEHPRLKKKKVSLYFTENEFMSAFEPYALNPKHLAKIYEISPGIVMLNFVDFHLEWKYQAIPFDTHPTSLHASRSDDPLHFLDKKIDFTKFGPHSGLHFYQVIEKFQTYEDDSIQAVCLPLSKKMSVMEACFISYKNKPPTEISYFPFYVLPKLRSEPESLTRVIFPAFQSLRYGYYETVATSEDRRTLISKHLEMQDGQYGAYLLHLFVNGKGDSPFSHHAPNSVPNQVKTMVFHAPFFLALIEKKTQATLMQMSIDVDQHTHFIDFEVR